MKHLLTVFALFALFIFTADIASAAIKVSPAIITIDASKVKKDYITGSFSVGGGKDETIRFKVYPEFFEHNQKGDYVSLPDKGQPNSLMGKLKFYPQEFTCKDGADQKVRFTITDLKTLPVGESRLVLFLEDTKTKELIIRRANGEIGGKIIVKTRVGVPIYLDRGNYTKRGALDSVVFKKDENEYECAYKITSSGNSRINYSGFGYVSQGDKLIKQFVVNGSSVDPNKSLERIQKIDGLKDLIADGQEYKIKFVVTYKDENDREKVLKKEFMFIPNKPTQIKI